MPSTDRKLELKAWHRWLRPPHRRLCINRPSELSRLTGGCVGQRVNVPGCATAILFYFVTSNFIPRWYTKGLYRTACQADLSNMRTVMLSLSYLCHCPSKSLSCVNMLPTHYIFLVYSVKYILCWLVKSMHN
jgi:hypothetical protein